jgi:hypothetical protein
MPQFKPNVYEIDIIDIRSYHDFALKYFLNVNKEKIKGIDLRCISCIDMRKQSKWGQCQK